MQTVTIEAQPRQTGRAATRAIRRAGEVPCVLYGHSTEPVHFRAPILALRPLIYTNQTHRVSLQIEGATHDCILKAVDFHPVRDVPIHADFQALMAGETIDVMVPIQVLGTPLGVQEGGSLIQMLTDLEVRCLPANIPGSVEIDVSALAIGDALHVSDLEVEDVEILADPTTPVVAVAAPRAEEEPEVEEEELLAEEDEELAEEDEDETEEE